MRKLAFQSAKAGSIAGIIQWHMMNKIKTFETAAKYMKTQLMAISKRSNTVSQTLEDSIIDQLNGLFIGYEYHLLRVLEGDRASHYNGKHDDVAVRVHENLSGWAADWITKHYSKLSEQQWNRLLELWTIKQKSEKYGFSYILGPYRGYILEFLCRTHGPANWEIDFADQDFEAKRDDQDRSKGDRHWYFKYCDKPPKLPSHPRIEAFLDCPADAATVFRYDHERISSFDKWKQQFKHSQMKLEWFHQSWGTDADSSK